MTQISSVTVMNRDGSIFYHKQYLKSKNVLEMSARVYKGFCKFEERLSFTKAPLGKPEYFGVLHSFAKSGTLYGYKTPLGYKIIVFVEPTTNPIEAEVKELCETIKELVFDAIMDPFYDPFKTTRSKKFIKAIDGAVDTFSGINP